MNLGRVIIVCAGPLSARDRYRFGVDDFQQSGFDLEVWAVHQIFAPRQDSVERAIDGIAYREFNSWPELVYAGDRLSRGDVSIAIEGMGPGQESRYGPLRDVLFTSKASVGAVAPGALPAPRPASPGQRTANFLNAVRSGSRSPRASIQRLYAEMRSATATARRARWMKPHGLTWAWTGPNLDGIDSRLLVSGTLKRRLHVWDFDLELKNPVVRAPRTGLLYLDSLGPLHPDFAIHQRQLYLSAEEWFTFVTRELASIESQSNEPVTVAAHPRAPEGSLDSWYPGFEVVYGRTRELVANSHLVLCSEASSALTFCAMYDTPTLFLQTPAGWPGHLERMEVFAQVAGLTITSATQFPSNWRDAKSFGPERETFLASWVRSPDAPSQPFWETVMGDIASSSRSSFE